jgi:hypothetical protein
VTDRIRELQSEGKFPASVSIIPVKFGSKPFRPFRFKQLKDELWWVAREYIREQLVALPDDDRIRSWRCPRGTDFKLQMTSPLYEYNSLDQIDVFDKRVDGKERTYSLPTKSPDLAHAFILGVRYYMRQEVDEERKAPPRSQGEALFNVVQAAAKAATTTPIRDPFRRNR